MTLPDAKKHLGGCGTAVNVFALCCGATLIIDIFVWLHCFCYATAEQVQAGDFSGVTQGVMNRIRRLQHYGIFCIAVFDGADSDAKAGTKLRRQTRQKARLESLMRRAEEHSSTPLSSEEKRRLAAAGAKITLELVLAVVNELRRCGVAYLFGPVEADHQCIQEARSLRNTYILTVDQDFLVHENVRVLLDVDFVTGAATLYALSVTAEALQASAAAAAAPATNKRKRGGGEKEGALTTLLRRHGFAVLLAYAQLSHTDYGGFNGVGPATVLKALQHCAPGELSAAALAKALVAVARGGGLNVGDVQQTIERTGTAFLAGLVFDRVSRSVVHLDGRLHTAELDFLGEFVSDGDEAALRSLGLRCHRKDCGCASSADHRHDLVPVRVLVRPGESQPTRLSFDLCQGSQLKKDILCKKPCPYTVEQLDTFLRRRRYPLTRGVVADENNNKEKKVAYVLSIVEQEEASSVPVALYSDGLCFIDLLVARGEEQRRAWPQYDNDLATHCRDSKGWINKPPSDVEIRSSVPLLTEAPIIAFYAELGASSEGAGAHIRVLEEGFKRIATRATIEGFGFLPEVTLAGYEGCFALRADIPRSMHKGCCKTMVVLRAAAPAGGKTLRSVQEVVAVFCDEVCPAAKGGKCVHGSQLLQVAENLDRPSECNESSLCTSKLCKWNTPGANIEAYKCTNPVACLPFFHLKRLAEEAKRAVLAHQEDEGRLGFIPAETAAWAAFKADSEGKTQLLREAFDFFSKDGAPCALGALLDDRLYEEQPEEAAAASAGATVAPVLEEPEPQILRRSTRKRTPPEK